METFEDIYKNVCRVCLVYKNSDRYVSLIDKNRQSGLSSYGEAINIFSRISIKNEDDLPTIMCQNCLILLKQAIQLKLTCEMSQKRLKMLLKRCVNKKKSTANMKKVIAQFALFTSYFPIELTNNVSQSRLSPVRSMEPVINLNETLRQDDDLNIHFLDSHEQQIEPKALDDDNCEEMLNKMNKMVDLYANIHHEQHQISSEEKIEKQNKTDKIEDTFELFLQYFPEEFKNKEFQSDKTHLTSDKCNKSNTDLDIQNSDFECERFEDSNDIDNNVKSSDEESCDDLLNKMYTLINFYPEDVSKKEYKRHNNNCAKRNKIQAKKMHLAKKRLQSKGTAVKINSKKKEFICKICNRVLANQFTYDHHMQRHNGCRYICEHCGKGFPVLVELQMHQVVRHGTGPFLQCQYCNFKAPKKFNLIEHERIHTGERPYTCDKCGLTFRRKAIWKKHMIYHSEKTVQCPQCPRKFYRRGEMLAHANSIHERVYVYLCHKCDATYAKTATVRRHLTERHGIPREMQGKIVRINKGRSSVFPEK